MNSVEADFINSNDKAMYYSNPKIISYYNTSYVDGNTIDKQKLEMQIALFPSLSNYSLTSKINSKPLSYMFFLGGFDILNSETLNEKTNYQDSAIYRVLTTHFIKKRYSLFIYLPDSQQDLYDYYMFRANGIQELLNTGIESQNQNNPEEYLFYLFSPSLIPTFVFSNYTSKLPLILPRAEKYYTDMYMQQLSFKQLINDLSQENTNITVLKNEYYWNKTHLDPVIPVNTSPPEEVLSSYNLSLIIKLENYRTLKLNFSTSYIVRIDKAIAYVLNCSSKLSISLYNESHEREFYIDEGYSFLLESYGYFKKFAADTSNNNMDLLTPNYLSDLFTSVFLVGVLIFLGKRKHIKDF